MRITFDSTPCGRCGGTGYFGPACVSGGRCFACGGTKVKLTPNGKRSRAKYDAWAAEVLEVPARDVQVGEWRRPTKSQLASADGTFATFKRPMEVLAVRLAPATSTAQDGTVIDQTNVHVTFRWRHGSVGWYEAKDGTLTLTFMHYEPLRRAPTADELRAVFPTLGKGATLVEDEVKNT